MKANIKRGRKKVALRAILFDFDGVIADTMEDNYKAWHKVLSEIGVKIKRQDYFPLEGMKLTEVAKKLSGGLLSEEDAEEIVRRKEKYYKAANMNKKAILYPYVAEFLAFLSRQGIPTALVTAGLKERLEHSVSTSFLAQFSAVVFGNSTLRGKPYPDPYAKAAEMIGMEPSACVVIENAPLGVRAAKEAGAYCVAITSTLKKDHLKEADEIVGNFRAATKTHGIKEVMKNHDYHSHSV